MKSERRHELQRNTLEAEIYKIGQFLRKRGNVLAWSVLGVAAVVLVTVWYLKKTDRDTSNTQGDYSHAVLSTSEERGQILEAVAAKSSMSMWASLACDRLGDEQASTMLERWYHDSEADREGQRAKAAEQYERVLSEFPKESVAVAQAHYGLAKLAESFGELDKAHSEYQQVIAMQESLAGQPILYLANDAMMRLDQFEGRVFLAASRPATQESTTTSVPSRGAASGPASRAAAPKATTMPASGPAPTEKASSAPTKTD